MVLPSVKNLGALHEEAVVANDVPSSSNVGADAPWQPTRATSEEIRDLVSAYILAQRMKGQKNIWSSIFIKADHSLRVRIDGARQHAGFSENAFDESLRYVLPTHQLKLFVMVRDKALSIYESSKNEVSAARKNQGTENTTSKARKKVASNSQPVTKTERKSENGKSRKLPVSLKSLAEPTIQKQDDKHESAGLVSEKHAKKTESSGPLSYKQSKKPESSSEARADPWNRSLLRQVMQATQASVPKGAPAVTETKISASFASMQTDDKPGESESPKWTSKKYGLRQRSLVATEKVTPERKKKTNLKSVDNSPRVSTKVRRPKTGSTKKVSPLQAPPSPPPKIVSRHRSCSPKRNEDENGDKKLSSNFFLYATKPGLFKSGIQTSTSPSQSDDRKTARNKRSSSEPPTKSRRAAKLAAKIAPPRRQTNEKAAKDHLANEASVNLSPLQDSNDTPATSQSLTRETPLITTGSGTKSTKPRKRRKVAQVAKGKATNAEQDRAIVSKTIKEPPESATLIIAKGTTTKGGASQKGRTLAKETKASNNKSRKKYAASARGAAKGSEIQGERKISQIQANDISDAEQSSEGEPTINFETDVRESASFPVDEDFPSAEQSSAIAEAGLFVSLWQKLKQSFVGVTDDCSGKELPSSDSPRKRKRYNGEEEGVTNMPPAQQQVAGTDTAITIDNFTLMASHSSTLATRPISTVLQRVQCNLGITNVDLSEPQVNSSDVDFSKYREMLERHGRRLTETFEHLKLRFQREWHAIMRQSEADHKTKWPELLENQKNRWADFQDDVRSLMGRCARDFHQKVIATGRELNTVPERRFYACARQSLKWRQERLEDTVRRMNKDADGFFGLDRDLQLVEWVEFLKTLEGRFKVLQTSEEALLMTHLEGCANILHDA